MASVSQIAPGLQNLHDNALKELQQAPLGAGTLSAGNSTGATAVKAPQDTLTLTGAAPNGPPAEANGTELQVNVVQAQIVVQNGNAGGNAPAAANAPDVNTATPTAAAQVQTNAATAEATANNTAVAAAESQQQQLAQLDQVLQELGIDPYGISQFNQIAMLIYVNDPTALEQFVQLLQGAAANQANGNAAVQAAQQNAPTTAATAPAAQAGDGTQITAEALPLTAIAGASSGGQNQFALRFQELQLTFEEGQSGSQGSANSGSQGQALSVTA
jgi:histone deacetylase complex regulatory component SIN3